jgi:hypothetical protein
MAFFDAPCQLHWLAGHEHGRTIPLVDMEPPQYTRLVGPATGSTGAAKTVAAAAKKDFSKWKG